MQNTRQPSNQSLKINPESNIDDSSESEAIVEALNHDDATLNDLLARADKLETTFKKKVCVKLFNY